MAEGRWELSAERSPGFGPIAERFRRAGDHERAVALCREGLARFPNHLSGRVTLGWALLDLGRYDEARVELERVIKRAPDNLAAIRGLAELHDREEHADFVPAETPGAAWPPKPDAVEVPEPVANTAWRDPDAAVTESVLPAAPVANAETAAADDELPALTAPLVALEAGADEVIAEAAAAAAAAAALEPLQAVIDEIEASNALPAVDTPIPVAELAGNDSADLDAELLALTRNVEQEAMPAAADTAVPAVELSASAIAAADVEPHFDEIVLHAPPVDVVADVVAPEVAALTEDVEVELAPIAAEPALELTFNEGVDPLLEAAEAVEVMAVPVDEPARANDSTPFALPPVEIGDEFPLQVTGESADADVDVPLDPAVFELAREASSDHAAPNVEVLRDVFDLDPEPQVEIAALTMDLAAHDFPNPEPASAPLASAAEPVVDLQLDVPSFSAVSDHPSREVFESMIVPIAPKAGDVSDSHVEQAFNVSQAFASALDGRTEFASPQIPHPESNEPDAPVLLAPLQPPVADSHWSEPEQPSLEATVAEAPVAAEPVAAQAEVTPEPVDTPATPKRPVAGLKRFLGRVERRKAKLASHSAA